jgi:phosphatidylserine decarboxylase
MRLDPAGLPFVLGALALAVIGDAAAGWVLAAPIVLLAAFLAFFFRDPERRPPEPSGSDAVLSPADGRVLVAGPAVASAAPEGAWQQISIFLSPMDVHVNRVPVSGRVTRVTFMPGRFLPAAKSGSTTAVRPSWPARSWACSRAVSSAGFSSARTSAPATGSAS